MPVINGLTDLLHPCQVLADLQTVAQRFGAGRRRRARLRSVKYAWIGDGNNMANSWIEAAGILGLDLALACPAGYEPDAGVLARARATERGRDHRRARAGGGGRGAARDLDRRVRVDGAGGGGRGAPAGVRRVTASTRALMRGAAPDAIVLHCLPAHRGEEITDEVIEGPPSAVWQQAENRLHAQKALLELGCCP